MASYARVREPVLPPLRFVQNGPRAPSEFLTPLGRRELRRLYQEATGTPLPEPVRGTDIQVNGWVGLERMRVGEACGRQPADNPRAMILIRFE